MLRIGPSNVPKSVRVVDAESYAIAPNGRRYRIETEPHRPGAGAYVEDRVDLLDRKGRRGNVFVGHGRWEFVFVLETPGGRDAPQLAVDS